MHLVFGRQEGGYSEKTLKVKRAVQEQRIPTRMLRGGDGTWHKELSARAGEGTASLGLLTPQATTCLAVCRNQVLSDGLSAAAHASPVRMSPGPLR